MSLKSLLLVSSLIAISLSAQASSLTFKEAFLLLKSEDVRLKAEKAQIEASETKSLVSKLSFLPTLNIDLNRRWQGQIDRDKRVDSASATAGLNLFAFGRDYYNLKSSRFELTASNERYQKIELEVEEEIYTALLGTLLALENVNINSEIEKLKLDLLDVASKRFKRGLDPSSEMLRAKVEVANARARTESAQSELAVAMAKLNSLGRGKIEIKGSWPLTPRQRTQKMNELKAYEFKIDERPDYREAIATLSAVEYQKKSAFSDYLPKLNFSVSRAYTENYLTEWETTYLLSVNFPLFSQGETLYKRDLLEATRMVSQSKLTEVSRTAPEVYLASLDNLQRGHKTLEARLETLGLSTRLYQENLNLFKSGRRPLFELLLDQERMLTSKQLANLGQRDFYSSLMNVCLELGKSLENCLFSAH